MTSIFLLFRSASGNGFIPRASHGAGDGGAHSGGGGFQTRPCIHRKILAFPFVLPAKAADSKPAAPKATVYLQSFLGSILFSVANFAADSSIIGRTTSRIG